MITAGNVIYLQLQKTGCSHVESLLKALFPDALSSGKHFRLPRNLDVTGRYIIGSVRDPWDWYLSYWSYSVKRQGGPYHRSVSCPSLLSAIYDERLPNTQGALRRTSAQLFKAVMANYRRPYTDWRESYSKDSPTHFKQWLRMCLEPKRKYDLFQDYGHSWLSQSAGLLTYLYLFLYLTDATPLFRGRPCNKAEIRDMDARKNLTDYTMRMESLSKDFILALTDAGHAFSKQELGLINSTAKTNASNRKHSFWAYYDSESIELVADREWFLIDKFGYSKPTFGNTE